MINPNENETFIIKYLVAGTPKSNKSKLLNRYVNNGFSFFYHTAISGVEFLEKNLKITSNQNLKIQLWDLTNPERFGNITSVYYRDARCAILIVNMEIDSINDITEWLLHLLQTLNTWNRSTVFAIIGQYADEDKLIISKNDLQQFAETNNISLWFTIIGNNQSQINDTFSIINKTVIAVNKHILQTISVGKEEIDLEEKSAYLNSR